MSFSEPFKHLALNPDRRLDGTGDNHYKTSFIRSQVSDYLNAMINTSTPDRVKIALTKNYNNKDVFSLQAFSGGTPLGVPQIGHFPCPDQCVPPGIVEFNTSYLRTFDLMHVFQSISYSNCAFLTVQIAETFIGTGYQASCAIFGVTQEANGKLEEKYDVNDKIFISIIN